MQRAQLQMGIISFHSKQVLFLQKHHSDQSFWDILTKDLIQHGSPCQGWVSLAICLIEISIWTQKKGIDTLAIPWNITSKNGDILIMITFDSWHYLDLIDVRLRNTELLPPLPPSPQTWLPFGASITFLCIENGVHWIFCLTISTVDLLIKMHVNGIDL
jgi:hypothetical protein